MAKYLEFDTPAVKQATDLKSDYGLKNHGLVHLDRVFWNLPTPALYEEAIFRGEGHMAYGAHSSSIPGSGPRGQQLTSSSSRKTRPGTRSGGASTTAP